MASNNAWPSWLDGVGYPHNGVGDLRDLKFYTGVGENGRWIGFINTGWYYHQGLEQYNYVLKGSRQVTAAAGSGQATESLSFRPAWGPILLTGTGSSVYTQHHNTLQPAKTMAWTLVASGVYSCTIPASTYVVGVRDLTQIPFASVSGTGSIIGNKSYWYDRAGSKLYIKPANPASIQVYLDLLELVPRLRMRELIAVDEDGLLLPSYSPVEQLLIERGPQSQYIAGPVSGFLAHNVTGLGIGDWVALEYFVPRSYVVRDHRTVQYFTTTASGELLYIDYETSIPDLIPSMTLAAPHVEIANWNPLFSDAYRAGYLCHANLTQAASAYWTVKEVLVSLDKNEVCGAWNEPFKALILVLDQNGLPVPWMPVTLGLTAGASTINQSPAASLAATDGRGEIHCLVQCPTSINLFRLTAICSSVTGSATGAVITSATALPSSVFFAGRTHVVVSRFTTSRRYPRMYVKTAMLDGIPLTSTSVTLRSQLSSAFEYGNQSSIQLQGVYALQGVENIDCIAGLNDGQQIGYLPQPSDQLVGYTSGHAQSKRILTENT
jgi:hypothetical protein